MVAVTREGPELPAPLAEPGSPEISLEPPPPGPLRSNPQLVLMACLLAIAILAACYVAAEIILPIVMALVLKLLLQSGMRLLERIGIPRTLAALVLIAALLALFVGFGAAIVGPATSWAEKLPTGLPRLQEHLHFLSQPIQTLQTFLHQIDGGDGPATGLTATLFKGTQHFASGILETLLILFFLLASGDTFLRRFVEILPRFSDKRQVVALSQQIEANISAYLTTITLMNAAVGLATGLIMWACGLGDPVLWGCVAVFLFAGLLSMDELGPALLPAAFYLGIHLVEGEMITPMLLARRFTLNPVLVIVSLIFWFWMWGAPGAILAVPLLAIAKIICDGVKPLEAIGHFLEG